MSGVSLGSLAELCVSLAGRNAEVRRTERESKVG